MENNFIVEIDNKLVILDKNLAILFKFKNGTKDINKIVSRHREDFTELDCFIIKDNNLRFQNGDLNLSNYGGNRYPSHVFTREGVVKLYKYIKIDNSYEIFNNILYYFDSYNSGDISLSPLYIRNLIYEIRGKQVMLDFDLAKLYKCVNGTKTINQAVKRHINKFPERFMFQLTFEEFINLKSQLGTSSWDNYGGVRKLPYAFTEEGVAMLATILRTEVAEKISIQIMDAFVSFRHIINNKIFEQELINKQVFQNTNDIKLLKDTFNRFNISNCNLFFDGEIYDAYSLMIDIFNSANDEIIIIDNYLDKNLLDILSQINKNIIVITNKYNINDFNRYIKQYNNIKLVINNKFHDRFIIIDKKILYHCGASFKDLGNKCFAINKINDKNILNKLFVK